MKGDFTRWTFQPRKHYHGVLKQQGRVDLDADWNEQGAITGHRVETETIDVVGSSGAPAGDPGFLVSLVPGNKGLAISAGRAYVDGLLCENEQDALSITAQPDLPGFQLPTVAGQYVAYLRVWLRHVIALDDANIREDALGGPDTCSRAKTVWQVGLLSVKATGTLDCSAKLPEWDALTAASTGTLAARAEPDPTATDPCTIPAKAGYRSLENQLYRVEIHDGSAGGAPTYKWSRDNGSVVTSWTGQTGNDLAVTSTGRDSVLGFAAGQWVELTDDTHELNFQPGTLARLSNVQGNTLTIDPATATGPTALAGFPLNPKIRRWDSAGRLPLKTGSWLDLESGVQVEFSSGTYATGDYWMIPARTLKADVDWPLDGTGNPVPQPPTGIRVHYAKLAIVLFNGSVWSVTTSCLPLFSPLTALGPATAPQPGIHITDVRLLGSGASLPNDSDVPLPLLNQGFGVVCDAPVAPHSVGRPTFFLSVDLPFPAQSALANTGAGIGVLIGFQSIKLAAATSLSAENRVIQWAAGNAAIVPYLQTVIQELLAAKQDPRLLARLTLKGNFVWGPNDRLAQMYVDGEVYGIPRLDNPSDANSIHTSLKLPRSGDGIAGGDFEMWFWLVLPVTVVSVSFNPNSVFAGQSSTGTVTLSAPAPPEGAAIALAANDPKLGTVPASLTIASGQTSGTFQATNTALAVNAATSQLQVTGSYQQSQATGTLTINMQPTK
jgi:hypothetical protein